MGNQYNTQNYYNPYPNQIINNNKMPENNNNLNQNDDDLDQPYCSSHTNNNGSSY